MPTHLLPSSYQVYITYFYHIFTCPLCRWSVSLRLDTWGRPSQHQLCQSPLPAAGQSAALSVQTICCVLCVRSHARALLNWWVIWYRITEAAAVRRCHLQAEQLIHSYHHPVIVSARRETTLHHSVWAHYLYVYLSYSLTTLVKLLAVLCAVYKYTIGRMYCILINN